MYPVGALTFCRKPGSEISLRSLFSRGKNWICEREVTFAVVKHLSESPAFVRLAVAGDRIFSWVCVNAKYTVFIPTVSCSDHVSLGALGGLLISPLNDSSPPLLNTRGDSQILPSSSLRFDQMEDQGSDSILSRLPN